MDRLYDISWFNRVETIATCKSYVAGETVQFQGQTFDYVGLIVSGSVEAMFFSEDGNEIWVGQFDEGDFIGQTALHEDSSQNFEMIAKTDVQLLTVPIRMWKDLLNSGGVINAAFLQNIAKRLDFVSMGIVDAFTLSARGRICQELVRLSREIGIDPDKYIIRPNPICVELARRVNSTRETVSRTVSDLQKKGILSREPGALIVQNRDRLEAAIR